MSRLTLWLTVLLATSSRLPALANEPEPTAEPISATAGVDSSRAEFTDIKIGFDGAYKVGHWTPIQVALRWDGKSIWGKLRVQTSDGDGNAAEVQGADFALAADVAPEAEFAEGGGTRYTLGMTFKPGRPRAPITVRMIGESGDVRLERTFGSDELPAALYATQQLLVEVGGAIGLDQLEKQFEPDNPERPVAVEIETAELAGFDGADVVAIATSDSKSTSRWRSEEGEWDKAAALDRWVRMGGTLILCVGREGANVLAEGAPLARFAPGAFDSVVSRGPGAWESFAGALSEPMTARGGGRTQPIRTAMLKNVRGQIEHSDGNIPLVVRSPHGFGTVIFVAADLDQPPFTEWSARGKLLLRLLQRQDPQAEGAAIRDSALLSTRLGYTDLSGQLRSALDRFSGVRVVSFLVVALLGLGFLFLLFPLEYLLVRRGGRFGLTWITFPLLLAGAAAGIWWFAQRNKGDQVRVSRVDIVDVDLGDGDVRGSTFFGLYSPATRAYNISIHPDERLAKAGWTRMSWLGLPGAGLGGMNSTVINPAQFERPYRFGRDRIEGVPLAQWSSKSFQATWGAVADDLRDSSSSVQTHDSALGSFLGERSADRQPLGTIVNQTGLDLRDCVLFYAGWAYPLGNFPAQSTNESKPASVSLDRPAGSMAIHAYLTERRVMEDKEQSTPYDPAGDDLARIARTLMFYDSAGGRRYTGLSDRYFDALDMTPLLRLGQAVLLARGPAATKLEIGSGDAAQDFNEESLAFYRFVIPVRRGLSSDQAEQATAVLTFPRNGGDAGESR